MKNTLGLILAIGNVLNATVKNEKQPKNYSGQADGFDYKVLEKVAIFKDSKTGDTLLQYISKKMVEKYDEFRQGIINNIDKMGKLNSKGGIDCKGHNIEEIKDFSERISLLAKQAKLLLNIILASGEKSDKCIQHFEREIEIVLKRAATYE